MASAQLVFQITNQTLRRIDSYVGTEGSMNYLHASFDIDEDTNMPNPLLSVYARYESEIYQVPKNLETGLYTIPNEVIQYPGFYISCVLMSGDDSDIQRTTEEVNIKIKGNGNILKRYIKPSGEYSTELLTRLYAQHVKNCENIKIMNDSMVSLQDQIKSLASQVESIGSITQDAFEKLGEALKSIGKTEVNPIEPVDPVNPDDISSGSGDEVTDNNGGVTDGSGNTDESGSGVIPDESGNGEVTDGSESSEGTDESGSGEPKIGEQETKDSSTSE